MSLVIRQRVDEQIELAWSDGTAATYVHGGLPKPCVHPVRVRGSSVLTGFQPSDHVWHRGLWFTYKFVNGVNFWEENGAHGVQRGEGPVRIEADGERARLTQRLRWWTPDGGLPLEEARRLEFARTAGGELSITWSTKLRARDEVILDRTPFTTWGGYGGLAFRASREWHEAELVGPNGAEGTLVAGAASPWVAMNGRLDGSGAEHVGVLLADHPANRRHPSPIYAKCASPGFSFANLATLFGEPLKLADGECLSVTQRAVFRRGNWTVADAAAASAEFCGEAFEDLS